MTTISMGAVPAWHAARKPHAPAIILDDVSLSWAELAANVSSRAGELIANGVQAGDRVAIMRPNSTEFIIDIFAIWAAGGTPMPLSPSLAIEEQASLLELGRPVLTLRDEDETQKPEGIARPSFANDGQLVLARPAAPAWKVMASGGSTGRPKLIVATREATTDPATYELFPWELHQGRLGRPNGVMLCPGPLCHNGPLVHAMMNMFSGSTLVLMRRFDALAALELIERWRVEFAYLVPTMMNRIMALPVDERDRHDMTSLAGIVHTAAACSADLKRQWIDWLGPERVWEAYGSTEAVASTVISGTEWLNHPGSVGRFFFGARGEVRSPDGSRLPCGTVGEIWVKGSHDAVFTYLGATPAFDHGWYSFGDLGSIDADGYVYISDRRDDLIIRGGNNVYPAEVEAALEAHPDVIAAAVIGMPDEDLGARVHAIVQASKKIDPVSIDNILRDRIAPYKRPQSIEFVDDNLRDSAGKLRRSSLRDKRIAAMNISG